MMTGGPRRMMTGLRKGVLWVMEFRRLEDVKPATWSGMLGALDQEVGVMTVSI